LEDGLILRSQAHLIGARRASWKPESVQLRDEIVQRLSKVPSC
jgi:hypothetical protein